MTSKSGSYPTNETPLAAYLIQAGFPLLEITYQIKPNGKRQATFLFTDTLELQNHITLFQSGKAIINLTLYERTKTSLIDLIMGGQRG